MNQDQFVAQRQEQWQELSRILAQLQKGGARRLPLEQVQRLGWLYRQAASDLAYAGTYFPGSSLGAYLNQLVGQAHSQIYAEEPQRWRALAGFLGRDLPRLIRAHWRPLLLAVTAMVAGGLVGSFAVLADPNLADAFVPAAVRQAVPRATGQDFPLATRSLVSTLILVNNVLVGVTAFAFGITLGVGTGVSLFYNGVVIGALAARYHQAGLSYQFWSLIVPHGVLELMAIFLCGAAGFTLGWSIIAPGDLPRSTAVSQGARRAVQLVGGAIVFFVVAALIEGWVTPAQSLSAAVKYGIGAVTGSLALAWWLLAGRRGKEPTGAPAP